MMMLSHTHTVATVRGENRVILEADVMVTIPFLISGGTRVSRSRAFAYTQDNTATAGII